MRIDSQENVVSGNGEVYPYVRTRALEAGSGRVASQFRSANDQFSGEMVPVPGTRTTLNLSVSGRTELRLLQESISLNALLGSVDRIPQDLEMAGGRNFRCCCHRCRWIKSEVSQGTRGATWMQVNCWWIGDGVLFQDHLGSNAGHSA
jgi:hypothetical protein